MKAIDLYNYLHQLDGGWVDWDDTVDAFKSGDPQAEVRGIAVGWMSYTWALQRALQLGCNVFVTHEPTYYAHRDQPQAPWQLQGTRDKRQFIEDSGLVILRCHDLWDQYPGIGIPDSWGAFLGLGEAIAGEGYYRVYDARGLTAGEVARRIAGSVRDFGQEAVALVGPAEKPVQRVALGTGAITPFFHFIEKYNIDLAICTDDGFTWWRDGAYAIDNDLPVVVVAHSASEEAGLRNLAAHLKAAFPDSPVHHIPQRCMYRLVAA
jgi:putative NIF3 family GTP cyclohydrolase 1 type 2